jgi:hypothetical protein
MGVTAADGSTLSYTSIQRMMKQLSRRVGITPRPMITDQKHADAAMADAQALLRDDFTLTAHTDEKIFEIPGYHGKVCDNILICKFTLYIGQHPEGRA